jgi:hypothetical protein
MVKRMILDLFNESSDGVLSIHGFMLYNNEILSNKACLFRGLVPMESLNPRSVWHAPGRSVQAQPPGAERLNGILSPDQLYTQIAHDYAFGWERS